MATREGNRLELPLPLQAVGTGMAPGLGNMVTPVAASTQKALVQRRGRSDVMWEGHKAVIKALYIDEGRSLKEVMEIMKSNYGLEGT